MEERRAVRRAQDGTGRVAGATSSRSIGESDRRAKGHGGRDFGAPRLRVRNQPEMDSANRSDAGSRTRRLRAGPDDLSST